MEVIENDRASGKTILLDGKHFVNCNLKGCKLLYNGGDFQFTDTTFQDCPIEFGGPAGKTLAFLTTMGLLKPGGSMIPPGLSFQKPGDIQ